MRRAPSRPRLAWLSQPLYVGAEVLIAVALGVGYSLRDDTISALGTGCPGLASQGCSSQPWAMNTVFIAFGALQAIGAWHLLRHPGSRRHRLVGTLWAVAGTFSILVGLLPVNSHPTAHTVVALPVFLCQPLALLLHARLVSGPRLRQAGVALGIVSVLGAIAFGLLLGSSEWAGLAERAAIWPAKLWLAISVAALASLPGDAVTR